MLRARLTTFSHFYDYCPSVLLPCRVLSANRFKRALEALEATTTAALAAEVLAELLRLQALLVRTMGRRAM